MNGLRKFLVLNLLAAALCAPLATTAAPNSPPVVARPIPNMTVLEDAPDIRFRMFNTGSGCPNAGSPCTTTIPVPVFFDVEDPNSTDIAVSNTNPTLLSVTYSTSPRRLSIALQPNQNGFADITVTFTDGDGASVADTFRVSVTPVNDLPALVNDAATMAEDMSGGVRRGSGCGQQREFRRQERLALAQRQGIELHSRNLR